MEFLKYDDKDASFDFLDVCSLELLFLIDFIISYFSLMDFLHLLIMKMYLLVLGMIIDLWARQNCMYSLYLVTRK